MLTSRPSGAGAAGTPGAPSAEFPPGRPAQRVRAPGWRDPRLLIGLVLVIASVIAGARLMAAADRTVPMFAARRDLPVGAEITAADVRVVRVRLAGLTGGYLPATSAQPAAGQVLVRPVGAGELIPLAALGSAAMVSLRPVTIQLDGPAPAALRAGGLADIWASEPVPASAGSYRAAQRIAEGAQVYAVTGEQSGIGSTGRASVQVLLPPSSLPAVLDAIAMQARIAVLPVPGAAAAFSGGGS